MILKERDAGILRRVWRKCLCLQVVGSDKVQMMGIQGTGQASWSELAYVGGERGPGATLMCW